MRPGGIGAECLGRREDIFGSETGRIYATLNGTHGIIQSARTPRTLVAVGAAPSVVSAQWCHSGSVLSMFHSQCERYKDRGDQATGLISLRPSPLPPPLLGTLRLIRRPLRPLVSTIPILGDLYGLFNW